MFVIAPSQRSEIVYIKKTRGKKKEKEEKKSNWTVRIQKKRITLKIPHAFLEYFDLI
jgi:hypothetical protein